MRDLLNAKKLLPRLFNQKQYGGFLKFYTQWVLTDQMGNRKYMLVDLEIYIYKFFVELS